VTLPLVLDTNDSLVERASALFSQNRTHRYLLTRVWDADKPATTWIMLNPSTADAFVLDPTVRRCIGFARRWGFGAVRVANLFALRSTDPSALYTHPEPIGEHNDRAILDACEGERTCVIAAWGVHGRRCGNRALTVVALLHEVGRTIHCLGTTKDGDPRHPLYVRGDTRLERYTP
jgi:hypothetical protein